MPTPLLTDAELALWSGKTEDEVSVDPWAQEVRTKVSELFRFKGNHPEWDNVVAPIDVRMIAIQVSKRTYTNPDQEVSTNVGPLGSRVLDMAALLTNLTDAELETIEGYNADLVEQRQTGFWTFGISGVGPILEPTVYLPDESGSDWEIPYGDPNDVNSPTAPGNLVTP